MPASQVGVRAIRLMNIAMIVPYSNITALGVRTISSCLKRAGHRVKLIFLPHPYEFGGKKASSFTYDEVVLDQIGEICADCPIVGISLMSNYYHQSVQLTEALRARGSSFVIWGGVHATLQPDECLAYADAIAVGEAEESMVDLADCWASGGDCARVAGFWFRRDGAIIHGPARPLLQDLDTLPLPDYALEDQFILHEGRVKPADPSLLAHYFAYNPTTGPGVLTYQTMSTRGCPHNCTYCCNNALRSAYPEQQYFRRRSIGHLVAELVSVKQQMPFVNGVALVDDTFFARPEAEIAAFSARYGEQIGFPLYVIASPATLTRAKMRLMVEAGLRHVGFGIQTGSPRTLDLYNRTALNRRVLEAARIIHEFRPAVPKPWYDLILDNPYETDEDLLDTLRLLEQLPRPYRLHVFSLTFFPGTALLEKARADGLLNEQANDERVKSVNFMVTRGTYLNLLIYLHGMPFPLWLLKVLARRPLVRVLNRGEFGWLFSGLGKALQQLRFWWNRRSATQRRVPVAR